MTTNGAGKRRFHLSFGPDCSVLVSGRDGTFHRESGFSVNRNAIETPFSSYLTPELADLVDVAMSVYAADRLCLRSQGRRSGYEHRWCRELLLELPVRKPELWNEPKIVRCLETLLAFMTEDEWRFRFVMRDEPPREVQGQLFGNVPMPPVTVALFSGGLDSLAGLLIEGKRRRSHRFILVSGSTNPKLASRQDELFQVLGGRVGREVIPVQVSLNLRHQGTTYRDGESSQRTRGFLHCLLGAAVSRLAGSNSLACYENGVGALNLPITGSQLGAQNARSAHPVALAAIGNLIELVTGREFEVSLPFLFRTKAEMCENMPRGELGGAVALTVSCDGFPGRRKGSPHCGRCTSCVLRCHALQVGGLGHLDAADAYEVDVYASPSGEPIEALQAMNHQVDKLRQALAQPQPWNALATRFPDLEDAVQELSTRGRSAPTIQRRIVRLYRRYCQDWTRFDQRPLPTLSSSNGLARP